MTRYRLGHFSLCVFGPPRMDQLEYRLFAKSGLLINVDLITRRNSRGCALNGHINRQSYSVSTIRHVRPELRSIFKCRIAVTINRKKEIASLAMTTGGEIVGRSI